MAEFCCWESSLELVSDQSAAEARGAYRKSQEL